MKFVEKYRKVSDVKKIKGKDVEKIEGQVYIFTISRGICKFTESLAIYHAVIAKNKVNVAKRSATNTANASDYEVAAKAVRTAENAATIAEESANLAFEAAQNEQTTAATEAAEKAKEFATAAREFATQARESLAKFELEEPVDTAVEPATEAVKPEESKYEPVLGSNTLVKYEGEFYVRISDDKLISFTALTGENGSAILGQKALTRRSVSNFKKILDGVGANIPTSEEMKKLEEFFVELIGVLNELFGQKWKAEEFVSLKNNLIVSEDKYMTYFGEYKQLSEVQPLYNLVSRKVVEG